jgi:hypothetical protein
MSAWILVLILQVQDGKYIGHHEYPREDTCKAIAAQIVKEQPGLIAFCIKQPAKV